MTDKPNEKSAGQRAYEKDRASTAWFGPTVAWDKLDAEAKKRWEWNASVTPKNQTIKAP